MLPAGDVYKRQAHGHALRIPNLHFQELDVLDALMKLNPAETPDVLFDAPLADISVCFGFMHHVPSCEYRVRVLDALVRQKMCIRDRTIMA